ncbi:unnamed protein product [Onchocerca flexuosa]|uniref:Uncharacterized protein n=1 Tax=Onchocerca flexuosa TaxID=387005 RepID=A0A183HBB5_9BILA|nr:unnamed protein product [Onchocerca flexuosa]
MINDSSGGGVPEVRIAVECNTSSSNYSLDRSISIVFEIIFWHKDLSCLSHPRLTPCQSFNSPQQAFSNSSNVCFNTL